MQCKYTFVLEYIKQERQRIEVKRKSERDPKIVATNCKSPKKKKVFNLTIVIDSPFRLNKASSLQKSKKQANTYF